MEKNDRLELDITGLSAEGKGIARHENMVVFVAGALVGERVTAHIILIKKNFAVGKLIEVLSPSPDRIDAPCPVFGKCGGCDIMHMNYAAQLRFKRDKVREAIQRIGKTDVRVEETVPSLCTYRYRNKYSLPVRSAGGKTVAGFFAEKSHRVVECGDCLLQSESAARIREILLRFMMRHNLTAYDEITGKGLIRHLVVRAVSGSTIITIVVNGASLPHSKALEEMLVAELGESVSLYVNINTSDSNIILGNEFKFVGGKKDTETVIGGLAVSVSPASFFQVNDNISESVYSEIISAVKEAAPASVIDAYCGAGLLTCRLAAHTGKITGIEIVPEAVADAERCARLSGIVNAKFICGDSAEVLPGLLRKSGDALLFLDPPRKGCAPEVISAILSAPPARIVYLSCDPATLARDIALLSASYNILSVRPYDMFPQTQHVETLVLFCRE